MDPSRADEQPTRWPPARSRRTRATALHRVDAGARLQLGNQGERLYSVSCSCGWVSEACGTAVLAEADGEQHVTLTQARRTTRRSGSA